MSDTPSEIPRAPGRASSKTHKEAPKRAAYVQVQAHRGGAGLAPENTMAAFRNAADMGVPWFEFDVRRCGTGELVVHHDRTPERLTGITDDVTKMSWSRLKEIDVGSHFGPQFAGEPVPLLDEVVQTFRGQVRFNIEIKEDQTRGDGTALAVAEFIRRTGLYSDCIVSSFNPMALLRVKLHCDAPLALVYPTDGMQLRERILRRPWAAPLLSVYALHPSHRVVTPEMVRKAHLRGLAVNTWTVNEEIRMRELVGMRVNSLITDFPDVALRVLDDVDPFAGRAVSGA
ncbi:MAG: glycerophosphodiester phosphodiesterase [Deltaproteobacteria bacterium]|nr:glycerophosphodiester phosphodiesterase [Deltaproteobacteria bacterium]